MVVSAPGGPDRLLIPTDLPVASHPACYGSSHYYRAELHYYQQPLRAAPAATDFTFYLLRRYARAHCAYHSLPTFSVTTEDATRCVLHCAAWDRAATAVQSVCYLRAGSSRCRAHTRATLHHCYASVGCL